MDLPSRLLSSDWKESEAALAEAAVHPDGDRILAEFGMSAEGPEQVSAAALLGDSSGDDGISVLRRLVRATGPGSRDLRCVSLLALAKRCGKEASADLTEALSHRDGAVKDYAIIALAGAGDGRAWDAVFDRLRVLLQRRARVLLQSEVLMAVAYLVQHCGDDSRRIGMLVEALRTRWDRMNEEEITWFVEFWPDALPHGPSTARVLTPDSARVRNWVRDPLFGPVRSPRRRQHDRPLLTDE